MKDHIFKIYLYIVWFLVNKTNFENQMNIYNLCISLISCISGNCAINHWAMDPKQHTNHYI